MLYLLISIILLVFIFIKIVIDTFYSNLNNANFVIQRNANSNQRNTNRRSVLTQQKLNEKSIKDLNKIKSLLTKLNNNLEKLEIN